MKVSEVIDRLKVGDTVWVKGKVLEKDDTKSPLYLCLGCGAYNWLQEEDEISLTEPQDEKVEVNEEQARLLKKYENEPLFSLICECSEKEEELLARARLCGYTIKPKRWVVKSAGDYLKDLKLDAVQEIADRYAVSTEIAIKFTDKSKAEAVATLVDGSVEEV
ncbi:hypothetical protein [Enterococcus songbeiensis]|uniref:hypothetical protein n=1 Tax=Enterococcus songbeiensis TaxID=2559927 RepID=UPI0010F5F6B7|nr:hypothetical protein [Enterococcus songbeiensis]